MNKHVKHKRTITKLICILFIAAIFLSTVYIVKETGHDCLGDHCPICNHIRLAEKTIDQLGSALAVLLSTGFRFAVVCIFLFYYIIQAVLSTPVTRNVRMNN